MMSEKKGRRTKIVCTLGPAVASLTGVRSLVAAGMDVARLNFSHGTHTEHAQLYRWVRQAANEARRSVGVLADLQGPKIRLGTFANGAVMLPTGKSIIITTEPTEGTADRVSTTYAGLAADVRPGNRLLVDDGNVALRVTSVTATSVTCLVTEGGVVSDKRSISVRPRFPTRTLLTCALPLRSASIWWRFPSSATPRMPYSLVRSWPTWGEPRASWPRSKRASR